jgi:hypothetical protein
MSETITEKTQRLGNTITRNLIREGLSGGECEYQVDMWLELQRSTGDFGGYVISWITDWEMTILITPSDDSMVTSVQLEFNHLRDNSSDDYDRAMKGI